MIFLDDVSGFLSYDQRGSRVYKLSLPGRTFLDIKVKDNNSDVVVFFFNGAITTEGDAVPPVFSGEKISKGVAANFVFISDPTLYLSGKIKLSWYCGDIENQLQSNLSLIIEHLVKIYGKRRSIFFGGSGGGFASLFYSRTIENALALVWNPQVNIQNYSAAEYSAINEYAKTAFGCSRHDLSKHIETDLSLSYKKGYKNNVIYCQNITDKHVARDLTPFCESLGFTLEKKLFSGMIAERIYLHLTNWARGHTPAPKVAMRYLLESFSEPKISLCEKNFKDRVETAESLLGINS